MFGSASRFAGSRESFCGSASSFARRQSLLHVVIALGVFIFLLSKRPRTINLDVPAQRGYTAETPPIFECPTQFVPVGDNANPDEPSYYTPQSRRIHKDLHHYAATFRDIKYDAWGKSYNHIKHQLEDWKAKFYTEIPMNGASIFESAMGIGLNLLLTTEILESRQGIRNITLYGNEYLADSVDIARDLFHQEHIFPKSAHYGQFCHGDSRNLSFVPSDAFDLVFCGYITPLQDPLHFRQEEHPYFVMDQSSSKNLPWYDYILQHVCPGETEEQRQELERMQTLQNDWWGSWVSEMIRIAKPGVPVIVEEVPLPLCSTLRDWGGVSRDFWMTGPSKYGWPIDPLSTVFENRTVSDGPRYHVFMRKRQAP